LNALEDCDMRFRRAALLLTALVLAGLPTLVSAHAPDASKEPPRKVPAFRLRDPRDNKVVDTAAWKDSKAAVVLFLGTECPINNDYLMELARLHGTYSAKGVHMVGVNSNRQDTPARVAEHARRHKVPFPVVKDPGNKVADQFGAQRTPEAFLLDGSGRVLYHGRIDDQFGIGYRRPGKPTRRDLAEAIDEVLSGKLISKPRTEVAGCFIGKVKEAKKEGAVTYTKHVSRILQKHCQECHRPGQIGPMALLKYSDAAAWADTIREVIDENRMPPWYADSRFGKWSNERRLSAEERKTLMDWVDAGTPYGDEGDMPSPGVFPQGWQIGKPDLILKLPSPFTVPAETPKGGVPYKYIAVPTHFKEDRWVVRAEARAGAPEVVHHILIFIMPPGEIFRPDGPGNVLCGMAPGDLPMMLKPGFAKKIPAGARLLFQMHYTPNGKEQIDESSLGLIFAKEPPKHRVLTKPIHNGWFMAGWFGIPPGAENFAMEAAHTFKENVHLLAFMPHMHLRGKDFTYEAHYPRGKKETLLSVPRYNFNWQSIYWPEKPIPLAKGTKLHCLAHYDNSSKNPNNPDPARKLFWGDQTWEEMMVGWIDYYRDEEKPSK
jgi:peroxiredoxin/mono/diheme cytochrome c family protein